MFCSNCGTEVSGNTNFCTNCGCAVENEQLTAEKITEKVSAAFSSKTFLGALIFYSVAVIFSIIPLALGMEIDFPIINIIVAVSFWCLYSNAKNMSHFSSYIAPIKTVRITLKVLRIIIWIVVGSLAVASLILLAAAIMFSKFGPEFLDVFADFDVSSSWFNIQSISPEEPIFFTVLIALCVAFLLISFLVALLNIFAFGSFYKMANSFENGLKTGNMFVQKAKATKDWLIVMGVCSLVAVLFSFKMLENTNETALNMLNILSSICSGIACLLFAKVCKEEIFSRQIEN